MKLFASLSLGCLCLIALFSVAVRAEDEMPKQTPPAMDQPKPAAKGAMIKAEDAKDNVGNEVIVEFVVLDSRLLEDKGLCFLNSTSDREDPNRFTAVIKKSALSKFKDDSKIENPADHFSQKKIRVSGKITTYKDKPQIEVNSPSQIKVVEEESAAPKG